MAENAPAYFARDEGERLLIPLRRVRASAVIGRGAHARRFHHCFAAIGPVVPKGAADDGYSRRAPTPDNGPLSLFVKVLPRHRLPPPVFDPGIASGGIHLVEYLAKLGRIAAVNRRHNPAWRSPFDVPTHLFLQCIVSI